MPNAANLVAGNDVRVGGTRVGDDLRHHGRARPGRQRLRAADDQAADRPGPAAKDSTSWCARASALGLKYVQITKGNSQGRLGRRRHRPAVAGQADPRRVRRGPEHVRRADPQGPAGPTRRVRRRRWPGAARTSTARSRSSTRCCATSMPVMQNLSDRRTRLRAAVPGAASGGARDRRAGGPDPGRPVRQPRHDVRARSNEVRPEIAALDRGRARPRWTPRSRAFPSSGRSWPTAAALFRELRPGVKALRTAAPDLAEAVDERRALAAPVGRAQRAPDPDVRVAGALRRPTRPRTLGISDLQTTTRRPRADDRPPGTRPDRLQLHDAVVPQHRLAAQRRRRQRHLAALHGDRGAQRAQQRGRPRRPSRPPARRATTTCTPTRTRTRPRRASPTSARPATSATCAGQTVIGNQPGTQARQDREDQAEPERRWRLHGNAATSRTRRSIPRKDRRGVQPRAGRGRRR